ncbi:mucin-5B-like [Papaver somniferum]|uniref:mucin-5B-like n=1 Tax=Papaver somniferum TaxID=3469 RepID=UPI000E7025DD|nr:mucin-5B-like [Papaver somniferum]
MVELRSGSATSPENTNAEPVPGTNTPFSGTTTPLTNPNNTERDPSGVTPPVTRARAAATPNVSTRPTNLSSTENAPSGVTPPVTRARVAVTAPNASSSMTPPTVTRTTVTPPSGRETREAKRSRPYVTIADLMERQEVLAEAQTYMDSTQKEVLVFFKTLTEQLPQESRHPEPMRNTSNTPGVGTSAGHTFANEETRAGTPLERNQPSNFVTREDLEQLLRNRVKNKAKLGASPLPVSTPERFSKKPSDLLPYQQLTKGTRSPGQSPLALARRFQTQVGLGKQPSLEPVTSSLSPSWGLGPIIDTDIVKRCEWGAGPFKRFTKNLEAAAEDDETKSQADT